MAPSRLRKPSRAALDRVSAAKDLIFRVACLTMLVITLFAAEAKAAEWRLRSSVSAKENYTDNLRLAPRGSEQSDWVTEVGPRVGITGKGARLQVDADYSFLYRAYANNEQSNGYNNSLRANGLLEVLDQNLFLQGSANVAQQNISTLGAISSSNVNLTSNQTEVRQVSLKPYWVSRLGRFANLRADWNWARAESDGTTSALNSETRSAQIAVSSGPSFGDLGWSVTYSNSQIESSSGQFTERELQTYTANFRYRLWPTLTALTTVGRDHNTYGSARGSTSGEFYTAGFEWVTSARTKISAQLGERFYGKTAVLDASHRTRLTSWQVSYSEQVVATPGLFSLPVNTDTAVAVDRLFLSQFPDPIQRQQVVEAYITQNGLPSTLTTSVDFLTNQVSLSKRLQGVFGLRGTRGSLLLTAYHADRESLTSDAPVVATDPFALSNSTVQIGFSGILSWRFSEFTSGSASLAQQKSKLSDASRVDKNNSLRLGVTHRLGPRVSGSVEYRFLDRDSSAATSDVRENAVVGTLSMSF